MATAPYSEPSAPDRHDTLVVVTAVLAALALVAAVAAMGLGLRAVDDDNDTVAAGGTVAVNLVDFAVEPETLEVAAGTTLRVTNGGKTGHNLAVEGAGLATAILEPSETADLDIASLDPGSYSLFCEVPGHEEAGMTGELVVEGDGGEGVAHAGESADHSADNMDEVMAERTKRFPEKTDGTGGQLLEPTVLPDGTKQYELTAEVVDWEVEAGKTVKAWTYNGMVPGPTIKVANGDKVRVILHNELPESTSIHFHGLVTPNSMDGVPDITQPPVKKGESFTYEFVGRGPAVGMYHSHHNAAEQVPNGLAATILVGDLPVPAGVTVSQTFPMMLNDAGTIGYSLNGKSFPATAPIAASPGQWVLVHYLNEGVQAHPMHLHGLVQRVIAKDGIPLAQPYDADTVNVAPGERYSVLVHADNPGVWAFHCHILPHAERSDGMFGMVTAMIVQ